MRLILFIALTFVIASCGVNDNLKDTSWAFALDGDTSTIVFSDSTYTCIVLHDGTEEKQEGSYEYNRPNLTLNMDGNILNASIDGDRLTTKEKYPITFIRK